MSTVRIEDQPEPDRTITLEVAREIAREAVASIREDADFNRSWTDGRRSTNFTSREYLARRLDLARQRENWATAIELLAVPQVPAIGLTLVEKEALIILRAAGIGFMQANPQLQPRTEAAIETVFALVARADTTATPPIDMLLWCPTCHFRHIDAAAGDWKNPPHRSHLCRACGLVWRPADVATNGVWAIKTVGGNDTWWAGEGPK